MVWFAALLLGIFFAWLGFKKGVYIMAAAAFNFLISLYLAVLAAPALLKNNPALQESGYYAAFSILFLTAACFILLQGICYYLFLRGADCVFPVAFEKAAGGLLGFLIGYTLAAFLFLAVCIMPFSRHELFVRFISLDKMKTFSSSTTVKICHFMAGWSLQYLADKPQKTIEYLISLGDPKPLPVSPSAQPPSAPLNQTPTPPSPSPNRPDESHLQ